MKFLTLLKQRAGAPADPKMLVMINNAAKAWIKSEIAAGRLDFACNVLPNASGYIGMGVGSADSAEAVQQQLMTYPAFLLTDFEVYPLSDVEQAIDHYNAAITMMMSHA